VYNSRYIEINIMKTNKYFFSDQLIFFLMWLLLLHDYLCFVYNSCYIEINIMKTNKYFFAIK